MREARNLATVLFTDSHSVLEPKREADADEKDRPRRGKGGSRGTKFKVRKIISLKAID